METLFTNEAGILLYLAGEELRAWREDSPMHKSQLFYKQNLVKLEVNVNKLLTMDSEGVFIVPSHQRINVRVFKDGEDIE